MKKSGTYLAVAPPIRYLENVDVVCHPADLLVIDPITGRSLGRPQVKLVQDRIIRMILGVDTSYNSVAASYSATYGFRNSIDPGLVVAEQTWPVRGIPKWILCDNGREFHSKSLTAIKYGVDLIHTPVGVRPCVERRARRARRSPCR